MQAIIILPIFLVLEAVAGPGATSVLSAVEEQRQALLRSSRGLEDTAGEGWSGKMAQRRKTAYGRLHGLGVGLPEPRGGQCATWVSQGSCGHPLFVCAAEGESAPGPEGRTRWKILRVSAQRARAFFTAEEGENKKDLAHPGVQEMDGAGGALGSYERWAGRDQLVEIPIREMGSPPALDCRVLYADACTGLVGVACKTAQEPGPPKSAHRPPGGARTSIAEYYLAPPSSVSPLNAGIDAMLQAP